MRKTEKDVGGFNRGLYVVGGCEKQDAEDLVKWKCRPMVIDLKELGEKTKEKKKKTHKYKNTV